MTPDVRCDLPLLGQLDHVTGGAPFLARAAFQRRFKFPDRRIARTPDRIERQARAGLAAMAFNFKPAVSAIETLRDGWRRLRWPTIAFSGSTRRGRQRGWPLLPLREHLPRGSWRRGAGYRK